jgi:hypothetical protein
VRIPNIGSFTQGVKYIMQPSNLFAFLSTSTLGYFAAHYAAQQLNYGAWQFVSGLGQALMPRSN